MSSVVFKNTNLVLPGIYSFCVLYTFLANSSCVMLIVVAGLLDPTNVTVLYYLPLLLFTVHMFETFEPHYATVAII